MAHDEGVVKWPNEVIIRGHPPPQQAKSEDFERLGLVQQIRFDHRVADLARGDRDVELPQDL